MTLNLKDCNTFKDLKDYKEYKDPRENRGDMNRTSSMATIQSPVKTVLKNSKLNMNMTNFYEKSKKTRENIKLSARENREGISKIKESIKLSARDTVPHRETSMSTVKREVESCRNNNSKKIKFGHSRNKQNVSMIPLN